MPLAMNTRGAAWFSVLQRPAAWFSVVQGWDGTYLPRPSHDDGTFTQGRLPQNVVNTVLHQPPPSMYIRTKTSDLPPHSNLLFFHLF